MFSLFSPNSFANDGGYGDVRCVLGFNDHWLVTNHTISSIAIGIPNDFGPVVDTFEILNGAVSNVTEIDVQAASVSFSNVVIAADVNKRVFVLSNTPTLRQQIINNLNVE